MTVYRLVAERANAGPHLFPRVFPSVEAACTYAERVVDRLAHHPGWRVRGFRIQTVDMGRVVTSVPWHDPEDDPDPFAPGGQTGGHLPDGGDPHPTVPAVIPGGKQEPEDVANPSQRTRAPRPPTPPADR